MQRAFQLALNGLGKTSPNPLVGCVITYKNEIIGEGWHLRTGEPHAEVNAIRSVEQSALLAKSRLYVNLEPCSHFGKTPPCSDLIIRSGIPEVVVANEDPNPKVAGKGISRLRDSGVNVTVGMGADEGDFLNRRFFTYHRNKRPYVILKWAETSDGFMHPLKEDHQKGGFPISGPESQYLNHQWRAEEDAILVGRNTVENDDPQLNVRLGSGREPLKIIIDPNRRLSSDFKLFNSASNLMRISSQGATNPVNKSIQEIEVDTISPQRILETLYHSQIQSVIIEGGRYTLDSFIESGLWDEFRVFKSNGIMEKGLSSPGLPSSNFNTTQIGRDQLITGFRR